jgi:hypothetical protein
LVDAVAAIPKRINVALATILVYGVAFNIILNPIVHMRLPNAGDALAFATGMPIVLAAWYCMTRPTTGRTRKRSVRQLAALLAFRRESASNRHVDLADGIGNDYYEMLEGREQC